MKVYKLKFRVINRWMLTMLETQGAEKSINEKHLLLPAQSDALSLQSKSKHARVTSDFIFFCLIANQSATLGYQPD